MSVCPQQHGAKAHRSVRLRRAHAGKFLAYIDAHRRRIRRRGVQPLGAQGHAVARGGAVTCGRVYGGQMGNGRVHRQKALFQVLCSQRFHVFQRQGVFKRKHTRARARERSGIVLDPPD